MVSGFSQYFQIARCFRQEDLRADRQPEFTQLDIEMSFVKFAQIKKLIENLIRIVFPLREHADSNMAEASFPVYTYEQVMNLYGSDKPDLRFKDFQITQLGEQESSMNGRVIVEKMAFQFDSNEDVELFIKNYETCLKIPETQYETIDASVQIDDKHKVVVTVHRSNMIYSGTSLLGRLRNFYISHRLLPAINETEKNQFKFLWVVDFPLFKPCFENPSGSIPLKLESMHHPFTDATSSLQDVFQKLPYFSSDILFLQHCLTLKGQHYDLVLNGCELGGGSVRIHDASIQRQVFERIICLSPSSSSSSRTMSEFSHLLRALGSGAPPHAGIALGLDRLLAMRFQLTSIRDTIAFPKNSQGKDLTTNAPTIHI